MSNTIYFPNNSLTQKNINKVISNYNLKEFTSDLKKEKVYKNEDLILFLSKKYIFIKTFLNEDAQIIVNVKKILIEGII